MSAERFFVVIRAHGEGWRAGRPLEEQSDWDAHARFMDGLFEDGFVVLAGPLGADDALLVVRADSEDAVLERLAGDPWTRSGLLVTSRVSPWVLRLGSL